MRIHTQFIFVAAVLMIATPWPTRADDAADARIRKSVVKIVSSLRQPDPFRPWTKGSSHDATGSGAVITGKRILTNAHVVNHASQVFVQPDKSSDKLSVKVEAIAPGIDLAVLKVDDESFFDAHPALPFSPKTPGQQQTIFVYGYPQGGTELSITRGIVSRVEFAEYYLLTEGLRIQVDAAINPGNSGGPAVADGQLIGIAFSKLQRSDNIGYIIPMEEIDLFLGDIKDGRYDGKPNLDVDVQDLENDALRARFKLDKKATGVLVRRIYNHDASYPLHVGDVITQIGDHAIDNGGKVHIDGDRMIKFQYLVQRLARDGRLSLSIMRDGKDAKCDLPVKPATDSLFVHTSIDPLSYFVFGPLVLSEASSDYLLYTMSGYGGSKEEGSQSGYGLTSLLYTANPLFTRYGDRPAFPGERIVIIAYPMFTHKIGKGYNISYTASVADVNGVHIRNLKHLVEVIRDATGEFIEFTFLGNETDTIVFNRKEALDATEEILSDNGIRQQYSADIATIWNQKKAK
jgi:S1-C subfamily serine protease